MDKMCPNFSPVTKGRCIADHVRFWGQNGNFKKLPYRKVILTCPTCGRRVQGRSLVCHDGCCVSYLMPEHKRKGWWKTETKQRKSAHKAKERRGTVR